MKVSVSLPEEDVEFLDEYAASQGGSRSAVVHKPSACSAPPSSGLRTRRHGRSGRTATTLCFGTRR